MSSIYPFIFFRFRRTSVVHVVIGGVQQLPGVELRNYARPVGEEVEASKG